MKIEEYLNKFNNKNYDLSLKEFFLTEESLNKGITIEEEIKYQESIFDGIFYNIDLKIEKYEDAARLRDSIRQMESA